MWSRDDKAKARAVRAALPEVQALVPARPPADRAGNALVAFGGDGG